MTGTIALTVRNTSQTSRLNMANSGPNHPLNYLTGARGTIC